MAIGEAAYYGQLTEYYDLPKAFEDIKQLISHP